MSQSPKKSPFKRFKSNVDQEYAGYIKMCNMAKNKAYKIYKMEATDHEEYGKGELAYIKTNKNINWRVQLPKKFLRELKPTEMVKIKENVANNKFPYLVYRDQLEDNSYKLDILEECDELKTLHNNWADVPEVEDEGNGD